jgi:hypothetical protein
MPRWTPESQSRSIRSYQEVKPWGVAPGHQLMKGKAIASQNASKLGATRLRRRRRKLCRSSPVNFDVHCGEKR